MVEYVVDTDQWGTFSGEVERKGSALDCARRKCEWGLEKLGDKVDYVLASEGSFGPHPFLPFLAGDEEILYFIDRKRGFHLSVSLLSEKTNYGMSQVNSWEALLAFAELAGFPSHALIVRPNNRATQLPVVKGIQSLPDLEAAFRECRWYSPHGTLWVETDMRAPFNPTRREVIGELATHLAQRLAQECPACRLPGWGRIRVEAGLPCGNCGTPTALIQTEVEGCVRCAYAQRRGRSDGLSVADPGQCPVCNP
ncbi:hypothetical protein GCM10028809_35040 [Spirosoma gilvum]